MNNNENASISFIADFDGDIHSIFDTELPGELPILPLRNMVLFPGVIIPVAIERDFSLKVVEDAMKNDGLIGVLCQKDPRIRYPYYYDLYTIGTVAKVVKIIEIPNTKIKTVLLQGYCRFRMNRLIGEDPYVANISKLKENLCMDEEELKALAESCRDMMLDIIKVSDGNPEATFALKNMSNYSFLLNFMATNINVQPNEKMELLRMADEYKRGVKLLTLLNREYQFAKLKSSIQEKTREDLDQQQKEYFLQQEMHNIQEELGENNFDPEMEELKKSIDDKKFPIEIHNLLSREIYKLQRISPQNPDYNMELNYINTIVKLPWQSYTKDNLDINNAQKVLDKDHYGLEKVKERILEYLAVIKLNNNLKSPILCLYGPPGVGKTSLGKSIAKALKRKYVRVSLGGLHDESEIRGHRRTYVGAMPGRILKNIAKAGSGNPVFVLDEIDKVSTQTINGDPSSALLEVLDPEQNETFHDNYLDMDYDLSKVLFIATANSLSTIPGPLLDRMELIEVSGYITEEKKQIAQKYLVPKAREACGMSKEKKLNISDEALEKIIEQYTRESGVRQLDKYINKVFRKLAYQLVTDPKMKIHTVQVDDIIPLLGQPPFIRDKYQGNNFAGVVTGLAWTSVGGEILYIETSVSQGKGSKLTLTGNLGDVMKESATLALEYIKAHASLLNIDYKVFENWNVHIHVPEGATPKDGPSAGITIATSIASALTQRKVRANTAMTGEITLRGKVLPVGGIKEKILAAKRAGITSIILSKENKKDIAEINEIYLEGLTFDYVETVEDVLKLALLDEKVDHPVNFEVESHEGKVNV